MIALDTNVVVRVITQDDPAQARAAANLMRDSDFLVTKTVLAEAGWVLTGAYGLDRATVVSALLKLVGLENAVLEDRIVMLHAISLFEQGLDFSDALHLASAGNAAVFATFDQRFVKAAARLGTEPPVRLVRDVDASGVRESATSRFRPGRSRRAAKR